MIESRKSDWESKIILAVGLEVGNLESRELFAKTIMTRLPAACRYGSSKQGMADSKEEMFRIFLKKDNPKNKFKKVMQLLALFGATGYLIKSRLERNMRFKGYKTPPTVSSMSEKELCDVIAILTDELNKIDVPSKTGAKTIVAESVAVMVAGWYWNIFWRAPAATNQRAKLDEQRLLPFERVCGVLEDVLSSVGRRNLVNPTLKDIRGPLLTRTAQQNAVNYIRKEFVEKEIRFIEGNQILNHKVEPVR